MLLIHIELLQRRETPAVATEGHDPSRGVHPACGVSEPFCLVSRLRRLIAADPGCLSAQDAYARAH